MMRMIVLRTDVLLRLVMVNCAFALATAGLLFPPASSAQVAKAPPATTTSAQPARTKPPSAPTRYAADPLSTHAKRYYELVWGVDLLKVKYAEAGELVRFSYRVLDPEKAKPLNDKQNEPSLIDPRAGVKLVIPSLEKVGKLRQSSTPETGKIYWMAFSNKGRRVKPGDRVNVMIGHFEAKRLVVE